MDSRMFLKSLFWSMPAACVAMLPLDTTYSIAATFLSAIVLSQASLFLFNFGRVSIRGGKYILVGHTLNPKIVLIVEGLFHAIGAIFGWLTITYLSTITENPIILVVLGSVVNISVAFLLTGLITPILAQLKMFEEDVAAFMAAVNGTPVYADVKAPVNDAEQVLLDMSEYIFWFIQTGSNLESVRAFESSLISMLELRGASIRARRGISLKILEEKAFKDPEERCQWLDRKLSDEVLEDIGEAYEQFTLEVIAKQNKSASDNAKEENGKHV